MSVIKAITFDLGNTLLRHDNMKWQQLEKAGFLSHVSIFEKQGLEKPTYRQWKDAYARHFEVFKRASDDFLVEIPVGRIFSCMEAEFNLPENITHESILNAFFMPVVAARQLVDQAYTVIRRLQDRGLKLATISNTITPAEFGNRSLANLGVLEFFDFTLFSSECLYCKPHPQMFEMAARRWGLRPASIVHVGDQLHRDVHGAGRAGFRTVWLNPSGEKIRHKRFSPDHQISSIAELPNLIESLL